jgi:hypothetical protein
MARQRQTAALHDIRELGTPVDRIVRLESNYESLRGELANVHEAVDNIGDRLDREFQRIRESARPNYLLWVSVAGLIITMFFGIGAGAYVPIWITTRNINDKAQYAQDQVNQQGIKLATMDTKFAEVETQFRAQKEMTQRNFEEIEHLRDTVNGVEGGIGLQDRVSKNEQMLADHDKYLWPQQQKNDERIDKLYESTNGRQPDKRTDN